MKKKSIGHERLEQLARSSEAHQNISENRKGGGMNTTQRKRLLRLADFIVEQVPKRKFNMGMFGSPGGLSLDEHKCNTAGCALGWATVLFKNIGMKMRGCGPTYKEAVGFDSAIYLFGLTRHQSLGLFSTTKGAASPEQIRRDILRLVAQLDGESR